MMKTRDKVKVIALWWYEEFDAKGVLYFFVRKQTKIVRVFLYFLLCFVISSAAKYILDLFQIQTYGLPVSTEHILILLQQLLPVLIMFVSLGIISYESIIELDIKSELIKEKERKIDVKANKKEWWRLERMLFITRIAIYLVLFHVFNFIVEVYISIVFSGQEVTYDTYEQIVLNFTIIYILGACVAEIWVRTKNKRKHNAN